MAKELESSKNHRVLVGTMMEQSSYSGPLPKPSDFAAYKETLPSAPERIMTMAEEEQTHRHTLEKQIVATFLGVQGHDTLAGAIIAITAVLASIFYLKKIPKRDNSK